MGINSIVILVGLFVSLASFILSIITAKHRVNIDQTKTVNETRQVDVEERNIVVEELKLGFEVQGKELDRLRSLVDTLREKIANMQSEIYSLHEENRILREAQK